MKKMFVLMLGVFLTAGLAACDVDLEDIEPTEMNYDYMSMDVNPSVDVIIDEDDKIEEINFNNDEAKVIAGERVFEGEDIGEFIDEWVDDLAEFGYLQEGESITLNASERVRESVTEKVNQRASERGVEVVTGNPQDILDDLLDNVDEETADAINEADLSFGQLRILVSSLGEDYTDEDVMEYLELDHQELVRNFTESLRQRGQERSEERRQLSEEIRNDFKDELEEEFQNNMPERGENGHDFRDEMNERRENAMERARGRAEENDEGTDDGSDDDASDEEHTHETPVVPEIEDEENGDE